MTPVNVRVAMADCPPPSPRRAEAFAAVSKVVGRFKDLAEARAVSLSDPVLEDLGLTVEPTVLIDDLVVSVGKAPDSGYLVRAIKHALSLRCGCADGECCSWVHDTHGPAPNPSEGGRPMYPWAPPQVELTDEEPRHHPRLAPPLRRGPAGVTGEQDEGVGVVGEAGTLLKTLTGPDATLCESGSAPENETGVAHLMSGRPL